MSQISVIVPVYKVEKYIHRCVDSILVQTYTDFELILVDDGSPDNCGDICDEYAIKDSRVTVIHQKNGGLSAARNAGIDWAFANSDSEWITFIDSDDWVHPIYLQSLYAGTNDTGLPVIIGGYCRTEGDTPWVDANALKAKVYNTENFYCRNSVINTVAWGKLFRKNAFHDIRFPVGRLHEDEFTTYKILFKYDKVAVVEQPVYAYFQNARSITESKWIPRRIDQIDGTYEQLIYFKKNGFSNAFKSRLRVYLYCCRYHIDCSNADEKYNVVTRKLRNRMRSILRKEHLPIKGNEYFYEAAYPNLMLFYWIIKAKINKVKREN